MPDSASLRDPGTTHAESLTWPREWPSFYPALEGERHDRYRPTRIPRPPLPPQQQDSRPGLTAPMDPQPDHGESSYKGSDRLADKVALITGGDSGIGRAVAIAFAREGADVAIAYLDEHDDARETARWVEKAGRARAAVARRHHRPRALQARSSRRPREAFGRIDVLVNNAAYQATYDKLEDISDDEWDKTYSTNIGAMFRITKAALAHMKAGRRDHQHDVDQRRRAESRPDRVCDHEGRDPELHGRPRATAGRARHTRELRRAGADLDAADSIDDAAVERRELRQADADEAARPARRTGRRLRDAGIGRGELYLGRDHRGDGRQADHLGQAASGVCSRWSMSFFPAISANARASSAQAKWPRTPLAR